MGIFDGRSTGTSGERSPLPAGAYGVPQVKDKSVQVYPDTKLRFVWYGTKEVKNGQTQHTLMAVADGMEGPEGQAFFKVNLKDTSFYTDAIVAVALGWATDLVKEGNLTAEQVKAAEGELLNEAAKTVIANNVPSERYEEETEKALDNLKSQIRINIGSIFRLQDWGGQERGLKNGAIKDLVGVTFAGKVEQREFNNQVNSEVKSVYAPRKAK